jgi:hypothetical protein
MTSSLHDAAGTRILIAFSNAMDDQQELMGDDTSLAWDVGPCVMSLNEDGSSERRIYSGYVADMTVQNRHGTSVFLSEIAFAQAMANALHKIQLRLAHNPDLLGACVITIDEDPKFGNPDNPSTPDDIFISSSWDESVKRSRAFGPIVHRGYCWMGSISCSVDVRLRGERRPRLRRAVSPSTCV